MMAPLLISTIYNVLFLAKFQVDVNAFQVYHGRSAFFAAKNKFGISVDGNISTLQSFRCNPLNLSKDDETLEDLYKKAKEEDEEWYNAFVQDVLGEDPVKTESVKQKLESNDLDITESATSAGEQTKEIEEDEDMLREDQDLKDRSPSRSASKPRRRPKAGEIKIDNEKEPDQRMRNERDQDLFPETKQKKDPKEDIVQGEDNTQKEDNTQREDKTQRADEAQEDTMVQFMDMYDKNIRIPFSNLSTLGYEISDVAKLQASVLELIIEDGIPLPENGLPSRWMVPNRDSREVQILRSRQPASSGLEGRSPRNERKEDDDDKPNERRERQRSRKTKRGGNGRDDRRNKSSDRRPKGDRRGRSYSPYDSSSKSRDSESSDSLWMDIPTFKQYLRKEAEFRLAVLGPDWEDWVKGESDWRLNLYSNWLGFVEDGVGDDIFEDLASTPASEREKRSPARSPRRRNRGSGSEERKPRRKRPRSERELSPRRRRPSTRDESDLRQRRSPNEEMRERGPTRRRRMDDDVEVRDMRDGDDELEPKKRRKRPSNPSIEFDDEDDDDDDDDDDDNDDNDETKALDERTWMEIEEDIKKALVDEGGSQEGQRRSPNPSMDIQTRRRRPRNGDEQRPPPRKRRQYIDEDDDEMENSPERRRRRPNRNRLDGGGRSDLEEDRRPRRRAPIRSLDDIDEGARSDLEEDRRPRRSAPVRSLDDIDEGARSDIEENRRSRRRAPIRNLDDIDED